MLLPPALLSFFLLCGYHQAELLSFPPAPALHCQPDSILSLAKLLWWDKSVLLSWEGVVRVVATWDQLIRLRSYNSSPWLRSAAQKCWTFWFVHGCDPATAQVPGQDPPNFDQMGIWSWALPRLESWCHSGTVPGPQCPRLGNQVVISGASSFEAIF